MGRDPFRRFAALSVVVSILISMLLVPPAPFASVFADVTPDPSSVTIVGNLQDELGCPGDWQPECANTYLAYDATDDVWQKAFAVPAGSWEYKAALNDGWDENYGLNAIQNGANIPLNLSAPTDVKFYYDHKTHWVTDNQTSVIATAPGSYQSELGCPGDWQPDCLLSWLQDPDGDGLYRFETTAIPPGDYEAKVAIDEDWTENYGVGGVANGSNIPFTLGPDEIVIFEYDSATHVPTISTAPAPWLPYWYVRGDFNGWSLDDPMYDDGSHGDVDVGDGVFTAQVTIGSAGRYEFKVDVADWSDGHPISGNSWLDTTVDGETVTITFDTNLHTDEWLPDANVIGVSTEPGAWTAVGDWQGWDNANPATEMMALGGGVYEFTASVPSPGIYQYKAVKTGTWDAVGSDGRSANAGTALFETTESDQNVTFTVDALGGRILAVVEEVPGPDDNIWWDGLGHNSRDDLYRVPGGAVTTGTPVTLRFRTFRNDVTEVSVRLWSTTAGTQAILPMSKVATTDDEPYGYDYWQAAIPAQDVQTILYYRFIVRDGSDEDYYEDDDLFDGAWGMAYEDSPDYSYQIDVYLPDFETPDWMKNAVVYQLFPDRFYNGDDKNDADPLDPTVYGNPVLVQDWEDLPEGYCRAYIDPEEPCDEGPMGRDFFGGDLQGVKDKLEYLSDLGVTAIYFNPIFMAPSNHLYDTTDYSRIDPYFGSMGTFQSLVNQARKYGIHIILDGVFNHTSSDSIYFDKYSRYDSIGAYESQESVYYDWYTFFDWPDSYNSWWGFDSLPVLTEIQAVRDYIYGAQDSVARQWIKHGIAGWRLDVAPDKSHDFWAEFRPSVKSADPEAIIIGEIWDDASLWVLGDELDTTMNYRFRRALLGFLNGSGNDPNQGFITGLNPDQFDSALQSIKEDYPPPAYETAMNLVGTHDTQRILWALTPGDRNREDKEFNAENLAAGKAKLKLLAIMQMTMPGAPTIYYGDEAGLTGDTDPDDRRPFPWDDIDNDMLAHYQALTSLRNEYSFLRTGSFDRLYTHNDDETYAYGRKDDTGAAIVAINRSEYGRSLSIDLAGYVPEGTVLTDALVGGTYTVSGGQVAVSLGGRWGAILITPPGTDLTPPDAPDGLDAAVGDGSVDLTWDAVPGAAGYFVYRSPVTGGGYERLTLEPLADLAFRDDTVANGSLYYYVVTAVDHKGNESARSNEVSALPHMIIGWANLQWPPTIVHTISALDPTENIYGQVWIDGHTYLPGATEGLIAQVGFGPDGSDPDGNPEWTWVNAVFNVDAGNNDEFRGQLLPEAVGTYDYAYRYSATGGEDWLYADLDGTGNGYDPAQAGDLTVLPSGDTIPPTAPANLRLAEASPSFITLAWDPVLDADLYRYEIYRGDASGGPYEKLADVLAPATGYTDLAVVDETTYYYVVLAVDTSFNASPYSDELAATAQARSVEVTFNVTVPADTPTDKLVYIAGSLDRLDGTLPNWDPAGVLLTQVDATKWTITLTGPESTVIEYKYTLGSWDYVEKGATCEEIGNRTATIVWGTDGTMALNDIVLNWRNVSPCGAN